MPSLSEIRTALKIFVTVAVHNFQTQISSQHDSTRPARYIPMNRVIDSIALLKRERLRLEESLLASLTVTTPSTTKAEFKKQIIRALEEAFDINLSPPSLATNQQSINDSSIHKQSDNTSTDTKNIKLPPLALNKIPTNIPTPPTAQRPALSSATRRLRTLFQPTVQAPTVATYINNRLEVSISDSDTDHDNPPPLRRNALRRADNAELAGVLEKPLEPSERSTTPDWLSFEAIDDSDYECASDDSTCALCPR